MPAPFDPSAASLDYPPASVVPEQLDENVAGIAASRGGEAAQLRNILTLARQLDEDGDGVVVAGVRESTQLLDIAAFAREFDQLVDRIAVTPAAASRNEARSSVIARSFSSLPPERSPATHTSTARQRSLITNPLPLQSLRA